MENEIKDAEKLLNLPLKYDKPSKLLIDKYVNIIADFNPKTDYRYFTADEKETVANFICEAVNGREGLEKRIAELEKENGELRESLRRVKSGNRARRFS